MSEISRKLGLFTLLVGLLFGLAACDDGEGTDATETCDETSCVNGSCEEGACACTEGYAGEQCDTCAAGYQDNDEDGTCALDCSLAEIGDCDNGSCDDSSGEALCSCDAGFELDEASGACVVRCGDDTCGHGSCDDSSGAIVCDCDEGYTGDSCDSCDAGYQDNDDDFVCEPDCASADLQCDNGSCSDSSGVAQCECDNAYTGELCDQCAEGYQDNDSDGSCKPACGEESTLCGDHGECDDASGSQVCACDEGYQGSRCQNCMTGYQDNDEDGVCALSCSSLDCGANQSCDDSDGSAACECVEGYTGDDCLSCAAGYQDNDYDGICLVDCATANLDCVVNSSCDDSMGSIECVCDDGFVANGQGECLESGTGESCSSPLILDLSQSQVTGSTNGMGDSVDPSCQSTTGDDVVYFFNVSQPVDVSFEVSGFDTVLHLWDGCGASELYCDDDSGSSQYGSAISASLDAGTYYLYVDGYDTNAGSYTLTIDWSCGEGYLFDPSTSACVPDPCEPNPCEAEQDKTRCEAILPASYTCSCRTGYVDDGAGGCMLDPNANDWTFIVYLNADNNLDSDGADDLNEMAQAAASSDVHIVVLMDRLSSGANIYYVGGGSYTVVDSLGEIDMSDWQVMRDFGVWAIDNYPAQHYAFIAWDHGDGWRADPAPATFKAFSNDEHGSAEEISVSNGEYANALEAIVAARGSKLDLVGFDACLMGMWEVAAATEPYADYFVASSETEPAAGWPYHEFLPDLVSSCASNDPWTPAELGSAIVQAYYNESEDNSTLGLTDLSYLPALTEAVDDLALAMIADSSHRSSFVSAASNSQTYSDYDNIDLYDFAYNVSNLSGVNANVITAANAVMSAIDDAVIIALGQPSGWYYSYNDFNGLSIYFPQYSMDSAYDDAGAVWSAQTHWDEFLDTL